MIRMTADDALGLAMAADSVMMQCLCSTVTSLHLSSTDMDAQTEPCPVIKQLCQLTRLRSLTFTFIKRHSDAEILLPLCMSVLTKLRELTIDAEPCKDTPPELEVAPKISRLTRLTRLSFNYVQPARAGSVSKTLCPGLGRSRHLMSPLRVLQHVEALDRA